MEGSLLNTAETGLEIAMEFPGRSMDEGEEHGNSTPLSEQEGLQGCIIRNSLDSGQDQEEVRPYGVSKRSSQSRFDIEPMEVSITSCHRTVRLTGL